MTYLLQNQYHPYQLTPINHLTMNNTNKTANDNNNEKPNKYGKHRLETGYIQYMHYIYICIKKNWINRNSD